MKKHLILFLFLFSILFPVSSFSWLKISEIYFAGTDERIEIYNETSQVFSWNLQFSGIKSSLLSINNLTIPVHSAVILWDSLVNIQDTSQVVLYNAGLSISDTKDMSVKMLFSGEVIDELSWTAQLLTKLKSTKASIQKVISWQNYIITWGSHISGQNILPWFFATPWKLLSRSDIFATTWDISTGTIDTGSTISTQLKITEVFFDGYDERIEISNIDTTDFSGSIKLYWVGMTVDIAKFFIKAGESLILSQDNSVFLDDSVIFQSGLSLTIQDNEDIAISLFSSGKIIDTFQVHNSFVNQINDQKISFEKVSYNGSRVEAITVSWRISNVVSGYQANPWTIFYVSQVVIDITTWAIQTGTQQTWTVSTWTNLDCSIFQEDIKITEVFPWDSVYPPFVELFGIQDFSWIIILSWSLLPQELNIALDIKKDEYLIISNSDSPRLSTTKVLSNASFWLSSLGWEVIASRQSWQVMDKIIASQFSGVHSQYQTSQTICSQIFDKSQVFSPGFSKSLLQYFSWQVYIEKIVEVEKIVEKVIEIEKIVYKTGWETCDFSCPVCNNVMVDTWTITTWIVTTGAISSEDSLLTWSVLSWKQIEIIYVEYDPEGTDTNREFITLRSYLDYDIDLSIYRLHSLNRTTKNKINWILTAGQELSFTWNYRFPNTSQNCIDLLSWDNVLDQYCYQITTTESIVETGYNSTTGQVIDTTRQHILLINHIDFNPDWVDTNNEKITITLVSWAAILMDDFSLLVGARKTKLFYPELNFSSQILPEQKITFIWNYRFPNTKETCVSLMLKEKIYDTLCYDPEEQEKQEEDKEDKKTIFSDHIIRIKEIVYDPPWRDTNNEEILLSLISWSNLDLSKIRLKVGKNTRKITGILISWKEKRFIWNYRFPNTKKTCVSIVDWDHIFDTLCYDPIKDKKEREVANKEETNKENGETEKQYQDYTIKLSDIDYDPEGSDTDNEKITIHFQIWSSQDLDLADKFYLQRWKTRRTLKKYGKIQLGDKKILKWTFRFPNNRNICVELVREDLVFDKLCYDTKFIQKEDIWEWTLVSIEDIANTENIENIRPDIQIKILSILPNPVWRDSGNEEINLKLDGYDFIDLTEWFYLKIWERKKYFKTGRILQWRLSTIKSNFAFPNKPTCVSIWKKDKIYDTFCYNDPEEWVLFTEKNWIIGSISLLDLSILNKIKLKKQNSQICATYKDQKIICKKSITKSIKNIDYKIYKTYTDRLHNYLRDNRKILFYNTPVYQHYKILQEAKKILKTNKQNIIIQWKEISVYSLQRRYDLIYERTPTEALLFYITQNLLPQKLLDQYGMFKHIYLFGN